MVNHRSRLAAVLIVAALVLAACGGSSSNTSSSSGSDGGSPSFTAPTLEGGELASASFAGKPTVLWFWAPWCTICRAESGDVSAAAKAFEGKVQMVGVAGRGEVPEMKSFLTDTGTGGFTHVVDEDGSIWSDYGVAAQPAFAFISADGSVETVAGSLDEKAIEAKMAELAKA